MNTVILISGNHHQVYGTSTFCHEAANFSWKIHQISSYTKVSAHAYTN